MMMIVTQRHWLEWDIRSWRWNIVGSTESVPRETQISWNGQEYNFPWFLRWDLCQISHKYWISIKKLFPYLLEIMHFIDLPRCIKPNSTSQAALYVWLWNFSGNKNCCCPGQTPWSIVSRNFSLSNLELSFDQTTQAFMHINLNRNWFFCFHLFCALYQEVWWGKRWKVVFLHRGQNGNRKEFPKPASFENLGEIKSAWLAQVEKWWEI